MGLCIEMWGYLCTHLLGKSVDLLPSNTMEGFGLHVG